MNKCVKTFLITCIYFTSISFAQVLDPYGFTTSKQQQQFQQLTRSLRCLVCQNESLAESQAPLAEDLRQRVAKMIIAGNSNEQISHDLVSLYGNFIHYQPPFNGITALLWLGPFMMLLIGLVILMTMIRKARSNTL